MAGAHAISCEWMGTQVETLEDLLRPKLRAVCVGINPAPRSVAAGHYYQGRLGQQFFSRLRSAGVIAHNGGGGAGVGVRGGGGFFVIGERPPAAVGEVRREQVGRGTDLHVATARGRASARVE